METNNKQLTRSSSEKMLGGVAGGLAEYFEIDPTLVRIVFVVLALAGGPGVLLYILLWLVMPEEGQSKSKFVRLTEQELDKIKRS